MTRTKGGSTLPVTEGFLLGGRLRYSQPADGYRTGIEPVLLAAAIPAKPGQRVLEAGTGAGAALMCLAARVPVLGVGVEIDPAMAELARRNIAANALPDLHIETADFLAGAEAGFDHAFANPPWFDARSTPSPVPRRRLAKQDRAGLTAWLRALLRASAPAGTVSLVLPSASAASARRWLEAAGLQVGAVMLHPRAGRPPKLAIVHAAREQQPRSFDVVLHQSGQAFTPQAEAALRHGSALEASDPPIA